YGHHHCCGASCVAHPLPSPAPGGPPSGGSVAAPPASGSSAPDASPPSLSPVSGLSSTRSPGSAVTASSSTGAMSPRLQGPRPTSHQSSLIERPTNGPG